MYSNKQMPVRQFENIKTPFYFYDIKLLEQTLESIRQLSLPDTFKLHYAVKANPDKVILSTIAASGFGADCVSGGEIERALEAGINPNKIVFAGVGKTDEEIRLGLRTGISCFNVESIPELIVINQIANEMNCTADVALRLNPDIDAHTHEYITTGLKENKFGISTDMLPEILEMSKTMSNIQITGVHFHIGSQITINEPFILLCKRIEEILEIFKCHNINIKSINVGGGLGVDYDNPDLNAIPDFKSYFDCYSSHLSLKPGQELHFELGRALVAQCGSLISRVIYVKEGVEKKFVILDAGMTDLIRPALYHAHHRIENLTSISDNICKYDIVGPICESSDSFAVDEYLPETKRGDLIAIRSAGAYGQIMASMYNCRQIPISVYSSDLMALL